MRLLFLNRVFWPDQEATAQLLTDLCGDLSTEHEVTVIAGPSRRDDGRRWTLWKRERLGRVLIVRTRGTRLPKQRLWMRLINLATYYALAACAMWVVRRPDVIIAETDPPLLGVLGVLAKRLLGCRFVYNVRDLYPDIAEATGGVKSSLLRGLLRTASAYAYRNADLIVTLGDDMVRRIVEKGVPAEKVIAAPDGADCEAIRPIEGSTFRAQFGGRFVVMYSGNLGLSQQLEDIIGAADQLRTDDRVQFVLIGEGARKPWLEDRARAMKLGNLVVLPYQPRHSLGESLSAADIHLIPLMRRAAGCVVPSKVYGILAAGRPFIAVMEADAEVARLARRYSVGFVTAPGDVSGLAETIRRAVQDREELRRMGFRARRLAEERFDRRVVSERFSTILANLPTAETEAKAAA